MTEKIAGLSITCGSHTKKPCGFCGHPGLPIVDEDTKGPKLRYICPSCLVGSALSQLDEAEKL